MSLKEGYVPSKKHQELKIAPKSNILDNMPKKNNMMNNSQQPSVSIDMF